MEKEQLEDKEEHSLFFNGLFLFLLICVLSIAPMIYFSGKNMKKESSENIHKQANLTYKAYIEGKTLLCANYYIVSSRYSSTTYLKNMNVINIKNKNFTVNENNNKYDYSRYTFNEPNGLFYYFPNCEIFDKNKDFIKSANKKRWFIPTTKD